MKEKLRFIFIPYLFVLFGLLIGYTLLNWLLFIKWNLLSLDEIIPNFFIPAVLAGLVTWLFLLPRLKILDINPQRLDGKTLSFIITLVVLSVPLIIAQKYLTSASGKLTSLTSPKEIDQFEASKYYTFKDYYVDKNLIGVNKTYGISGKNNTNFDMKIYAALPIFESQEDATKGIPHIWLGIQYAKTISNRLDPSEKEYAARKFLKESEEDFLQKDVSVFQYLERLGNSDDKENYITAITNRFAYDTDQTILIGINEPFEAHNGNKLYWLIGSIIVGSLVFLLLILLPKAHPAQMNRIKSGQRDKSAQEDIAAIIAFLKPSDNYYITPILINLNIIVFILMFLSGSGFIAFKTNDLIKWGANNATLVADGEWWRLITSMFVHGGGIIHLVANISGLWLAGMLLEPLVGRIKLASVYMITGIIASLASILWYDDVVSSGASGAIFGIYGYLLALLLMKRFAVEVNKSFLILVLPYIGFNLLAGLAHFGTDNAGHIGGLISGLSIGFILALFQEKED